MGPSGSGKTTLLNLIAGIDHVDEGAIHVGGVDITTLSEMELAQWRATHVGFIFQFYNLLPVLTALENVELPLHLTGLPKKERREHALMALHLVNLDHRIGHYPSQLSGGEQQRVAIARAIITDPTLLVADLNPRAISIACRLRSPDLMGRLNSDLGKTIIMVTHDPRAAGRARRMKHLEKGLLNDAPS
jgi:putative ABC transport system ATP-binding protein